jgi:nucleoside-diphosphate-sugar epimerase
MDNNQNRRILVTGGSGFIGTNYIELLLKEGFEDFINIDIKAPRNREHGRFWRECDILDEAELKRIVSEFSPARVVHLAAKTGVSENNSEAFAANTRGTKNLIDVLRDASGMERAIFTSSLLVCRMGYVPKHDTDYNPSTPYGESKVEMEKIIRAANIGYCWTIIRPISVWGPWFAEPYKNFFKAIAQGWYFHIGSGHYRRSLGYVENAVFQIHKLLDAPVQRANGKVFYVADDRPLDLYDMAAEVRRILGAKKIGHFPLWIAQAAAWAGDVLKALGWKSVPLSSFRLKNIRTEYIYDISPIMEFCGRLPYDYKEGVRRTIDWMKKTGELK